jgi:hypothetical protein
LVPGAASSPDADVEGDATAGASDEGAEGADDADVLIEGVAGAAIERATGTESSASAIADPTRTKRAGERAASKDRARITSP